MFLRNQLYGKQILTKDLQRVIPGTFVIARRQIIHGASALATEEFADAAVSSSYSLFAGRDGCVTKFFAWLAHHPLMYAYFLDASHGIEVFPARTSPANVT
jgi:type I restriction enzyme S subunit